MADSTTDSTTDSTMNSTTDQTTDSTAELTTNTTTDLITDLTTNYTTYSTIDSTTEQSISVPYLPSLFYQERSAIKICFSSESHCTVIGLHVLPQPLPNEILPAVPASVLLYRIARGSEGVKGLPRCCYCWDWYRLSLVHYVGTKVRSPGISTRRICMYGLLTSFGRRASGAAPDSDPVLLAMPSHTLILPANTFTPKLSMLHPIRQYTRCIRILTDKHVDFQVHTENRTPVCQRGFIIIQRSKSW